MEKLCPSREDLEHSDFSAADIVERSADCQLLLLYQIGQNRGSIT